MVMIPLGYAEGDGSNENLSEILLRNMYLTENGFSPDQVSRFSRPTLSPLEEISNQPISGFWRQDGTLDDNWFIVSGDALFKRDGIIGPSIEIGPLPGNDICVFAGTADKVVIVRNQIAYSTDGVTIHKIVMPDDRPVSSVAVINNTFVLGVLDTQRFYWLYPGELDPDPLSFASAERTPDSVRSVNVVSDELWFLGASGVEVWQPTGDQDAPFLRIPNRVYLHGCADTATVTTGSFEGYPYLMWVTDKREVVLAQGNPKKVSSKAVELRLKDALSLRAYGFRWNQTDFYILTTDRDTFAYNITRGEWSIWKSYQENTWKAHLGIQVDEDVYVADSSTGVLWQLEDGYSDNGIPVVREISGFVLSMGSGTQCSSVNLRINAGWPPEYTHTPVMEMRWSDDYGFSWTEYFQAPMGKKGAYEWDVTYRSLGLFERPGRTFEFRFSDIAKFRIDYATMNEV